MGQERIKQVFWACGYTTRGVKSDRGANIFTTYLVVLVQRRSSHACSPLLPLVRYGRDCSASSISIGAPLLGSSRLFNTSPTLILQNKQNPPPASFLSERERASAGFTSFHFSSDIAQQVSIRHIVQLSFNRQYGVDG